MTLQILNNNAYDQTCTFIYFLWFRILHGLFFKERMCIYTFWNIKSFIHNACKYISDFITFFYYLNILN